MSVSSITNAEADVVPSQAAEHTRLTLWPAAWEDIQAHVSLAARPASRLRWVPLAARVVLFSAGFHAAFLYRVSHALRAHGGPVGRAASSFLFWFGRHWYHCALAPSAELHGGLMLPHPQGIVVGPHVVVGPRAWLFQNVTLGGAPGKDGMPRVGTDARVYTGAVLTGPVRVGDHVSIGANCVVSRDVPSRAAVSPPRAHVAEHGSARD